MELYLIRHGIALQTSEIADEKRSLTEMGRQKTCQVAKRLCALGLQFDLILTSPLVRSRQTAEIFRTSGLSCQLKESIHLAPSGDIYAWLKSLEQWEQPETMALIGHQPDLGQWAETLIWGQARDKIVLKKAGIIGLTLPDTGSPVSHSQLFWLTPPKFLL